MKKYSHTQEWKDNNSRLMKGRVLSNEWKEKIGKANKGKKRTEEQKLNVSLKQKGRTPWNKGIKTGNLSIETRKKMSESRKGDKSSGWKGGINPINNTIRKSFEYKLWRTAVFERDNYTCVWCGARCGNGKAVTLNADHIKPFSLFPELRFAIDNGRTLCVECHRTTETYGGRSKNNKSIYDNY